MPGVPPERVVPIRAGLQTHTYLGTGGSGFLGRPPYHHGADWIPAHDRVEEPQNLLLFPDERALDTGELIQLPLHAVDNVDYSLGRVQFSHHRSIVGDHTRGARHSCSSRTISMCLAIGSPAARRSNDVAHRGTTSRNRVSPMMPFDTKPPATRKARHTADSERARFALTRAVGAVTHKAPRRMARRATQRRQVTSTAGLSFTCQVFASCEKLSFTRRHFG